IFAIATALPVIVFAWILAYTVSGIGSVYNKVRTFEVWFRRIVAILFIGVGIYYMIKVFF
ncbi:MAG TPA: sulfite exporter TauE/SafE family protein, partial [Prolixibacteraceae bacterium]|nr:sulfite exporter TauE/SafE family protein [Prolixibacteraceae bacterium]